MRLFSTMLDIKETMTEKDFIRLLIQSNQENPHEMNVIQEDKIQWDGEELDNTFGNETVSLQTVKYRNGGIMAAKFEKKEPNGMSWMTDYVWNLDERKMSIRLSRDYKEGATAAEKQFSPPSFIKYLIQEDFLEEDEGLPVFDKAILIGEENISLLTDAVAGVANYSLPVVYVSKKFDNNQDPINVDWLARKLRGVAHLLVQENSQTAVQIASQCEDRYTFNGAVTVYYPNKAFTWVSINRHQEYENRAEEFISKILDLVLDYTNSREWPPLYTWGSVTRRVTLDRYQHKKEERDQALAEADDANALVISTDQEIKEKDALIEFFDKELTDKEQEINELKGKTVALQEQIKSLKEKSDNIYPNIRLNLGAQEEYFEDEAKEIVLDAIEEVLKNYEQVRIRRYDILKSILEGNERPKHLAQRQAEIKSILKDFRGSTAPIDNELKKLGITFKREGSHEKYVYHENDRYYATLQKTGSDVRGGKNLATEINNAMF